MGEAFAEERRAVVEEIVRALEDDVAPGSRAWWQYLSVVAELGHEAAGQLVQEVAAVEAAGGMTTKDGSRRRTPGGIFFALAYERLGPKKARWVRGRADRRFHEEMIRKFLRLLALVPRASVEGPDASAGAAAPPAATTAPAEPTPSAPAPAATPPAKPARRQEPEDVEVLVVRRRPASTSR
jgi:hypothetical protein